ncbi:CBS domain-containing protein [Spirulina major CS-329]|uniref:CBS domain-containing protein n=1 Tax=Spirulina TaxID=1154 RepID=UPI00232A959B|nr:MULTISPECIES: CBS domain-containing protein [Spirulina]MDB9496119.1 CBS domain-containing protein [Spirulina subsalsa CS-330]MDB9503129.1 CBS domain-containing protein [Spirulina major CS-329]
MTKTVAEFMTPTPITVTPQTSLREAIQLLAEKQISGLPVVDDAGMLVGVLSDADLMWQETGADPPPYIMFLDSVIFLQNPARYEQELHKSLGQTVGEVMTKKPITAQPDQSLRDAARIMHEKHVRRLPVVDANGQIVGILSHGDIIRAMAAS